ncbi:hypothetical protein P8452_58063 [Trifolium repens]|nr:hypothetical protein P8452_58063 [Trifolium repens]
MLRCCQDITRELASCRASRTGFSVDFQTISFRGRFQRHQRTAEKVIMSSLFSLSSSWKNNSSRLQLARNHCKLNSTIWLSPKLVSL